MDTGHGGLFDYVISANKPANRINTGGLPALSRRKWQHAVVRSVWVDEECMQRFYLAFGGYLGVIIY